MYKKGQMKNFIWPRAQHLTKALFLYRKLDLFDASTVQSAANALGSIVHSLKLLIRKINLKGTHDTGSADHARCAESNVFDAVFAVEYC